MIHSLSPPIYLSISRSIYPSHLSLSLFPSISTALSLPPSLYCVPSISLALSHSLHPSMHLCPAWHMCVCYHCSKSIKAIFKNGGIFHYSSILSDPRLYVGQCCRAQGWEGRRGGCRGVAYRRTDLTNQGSPSSLFM